MSELHSLMLRCGYEFIESRHLKAYKHLSDLSRSKQFYVKDFVTTEGVFKIALIFTYDPYTSLPYAYIVDKPAHLQDVLLPHVNNGWYLCYVQEMEADWNPNDLIALYMTVDRQIQITLNNSVESIHNRSTEQVELEGEFSAYWKPESCVYSLSSFYDLHNRFSTLSFNKSLEKETAKESILYDSNTEHEHKNWLMQRGLYETKSQRLHTFVIKVRPNRLSGVNWPPKNSKELFDWLSTVDHNAKAHLANYFVQNRFKNHLILLEVDKQDTLGLVLELDTQTVQLSTYANTKKTGKKGGRAIQLSMITAVLSGKYAFKKFKRISFIKADKNTVLSRNRSRPDVGDLSSKRIALIGCGTIGGYVSELLIRSGAGVHSGKLHLFDFDNYGPQNFGRHTLFSADFGKSKSVALQERLTTSTHLKTNIHGFDCEFPLIDKYLSFYDIIIDATGRAPIAKRLAYLLRKLDGTKRPILIHGFNDGNGRASKVFIDYSDGCINCLWGNPTFYHNGNDIRFKQFAGLNEKKVSCGSTYIPYDAAVSVMTAALIQEAALATLENERTWNYKEHIFEGGRTLKPKLVHSESNCEICNAR
ncbi:E2/UBC family protein [Acinetobacter baumannii]|nr:E2/UBC family protein [Acinetobacter baumannii]USI39492.1 ThiF family adenylyltransferase [Acinetobacter baumannii]USI44446.1 ThiF family adenylyltransferase [Acinetobacter baumannii]